jgi:CMP-N-acetylneuraminic acid synthetase
VIDVTKPSTIFNKKSMTGDKMLPYLMNMEDSIDIDAKVDLEFARFYLKDRI